MKKAISILGIACLLFSFSGKRHDEYQGFSLKRLERSLVLVPKGVFHSGQSDMDISPFSSITEVSAQVSVDSFYMSDHEVSNGEYFEFIDDLYAKDSAMAIRMLPDTQVWRDKNSFYEEYVRYYFRHPWYSNYPVVGISHEQATYYCTWLTERYQKEKKRKYKKVVFKLPSIAQWTYAAKGGLAYSPFPWQGYSMQDNKGVWRANFTFIPQNSIVLLNIPIQNEAGTSDTNGLFVAAGGQVSGSLLSENLDILVPIKSYKPNGYGIYNMAGNVEELVEEKGKTKGGSWKDTGYYLQNFVVESHDSLHSASAERGFRFVMVIEKSLR